MFFLKRKIILQKQCDSGAEGACMWLLMCPLELRNEGMIILWKSETDPKTEAKTENLSLQTVQICHAPDWWD